MQLDLKAIQEKRTNLNAQEIGDDVKRAEGWKRFETNPVFDQDEVRGMVKKGVQRLAEMQLADGGWGWFGGLGRNLQPAHDGSHVHGLQIARAKRSRPVARHARARHRSGLAAIKTSRSASSRTRASKTNPWKEHADNLDALVYMVLVDGGVKNDEMRDFLYRDRTHLAVYCKAMLGLRCTSNWTSPAIAKSST